MYTDSTNLTWFTMAKKWWLVVIWAYRKKSRKRSKCSITPTHKTPPRGIHWRFCLGWHSSLLKKWKGIIFRRLYSRSLFSHLQKQCQMIWMRTGTWTGFWVLVTLAAHWCFNLSIFRKKVVLGFICFRLVCIHFSDFEWHEITAYNTM